MNTELKSNDQGFSLVELIVAVLITGIMFLAVSSFLGVSRTTYARVSKSTSLQEESLTLERVLSETLKEAVKIGTVRNASAKLGKDCDILWVSTVLNDNTVTKNADGSDIQTGKYVTYFFVLDKEAKEVRYCYNQDVIDDTGAITDAGYTVIKNKCLGTDKKYWFVAKHVKSMFYPLADDGTGDAIKKIARDDGTYLICLDLEYSYSGTDTDQSNTLTVVTRNPLK